MIQVSLNQIEQIKQKLKERGLVKKVLVNELTDHLACEIETELNKGISFDNALNNMLNNTEFLSLPEYKKKFSGILNFRYKLIKTLLLISIGLFGLGWVFRIEQVNWIGMVSFLLLSWVYIRFCIDFFKHTKNNTINYLMGSLTFLTFCTTLFGYILIFLWQFDIYSNGHGVDLTIFGYFFFTITAIIYNINRRKLSTSKRKRSKLFSLIIFSIVHLLLAIVSILSFPFYYWVQHYIYILILIILSFNILLITYLIFRKMLKNILFITLMAGSFMIVFIHSPFNSLFNSNESIVGEEIINNYNRDIDSLYKKWDTLNKPGVSVAVWYKGNLITKSYGYSDIENKRKITSKTKFDVASMSKQFTVMSILLLQENGKLSVNDDIRKYLSELPEYKHKVTIEHLMSHTSGIRDHFLLLQLSKDCGTDTTITNNDVLRLIKRQKDLNFKPGTQQIYCNPGYVLLAIIIEQVSGLSFSEYTKQYIFKPLKMDNSYFIDAPDYLQKKCAKGYLFNPVDSTYQYVPNYSTATGGTGLTTTAEDLVKWYLNFKDNKLGKGNLKLIKKLTSIPRIPNYIPQKRGYGMYVDNYMKKLNYWMEGSEIGYSSVMTYFPEKDFIAIVLSNSSRSTSFRNRYDISNIFLNHDNKVESVTKLSDDELKLKNINLHTPQELKLLSGKYFDSNESDIEFLKFKDSTLYTFRGIELIPTGRYQFKPRGLKKSFKFERLNDKKIKLNTKHYSYGDGYIYDYVLSEYNLIKQAEPAISPANVNNIVGKYKNEGTHKPIEIKFDKNKLSANWEGDTDFDLQPIFDNYLFSFGRSVFIKIDFDKKDNVNGFHLSYRRMRNLYFKKI